MCLKYHHNAWFFSFYNEKFWKNIHQYHCVWRFGLYIWLVCCNWKSLQEEVHILVCVVLYCTQMLDFHRCWYDLCFTLFFGSALYVISYSPGSIVKFLPLTEIIYLIISFNFILFWGMFFSIVGVVWWTLCIQNVLVNCDKLHCIVMSQQQTEQRPY